MKNLILSFLLILSSFSCFSQVNFSKDNLPAYYIQNNDTIGVILTVKQLQKLDYDVELLSLLEQKGINCDSTIKKYICVLNDYNRQVALLEVKISTLEDIIYDKDEMIQNLKSQIINYQADITRAETQLQLKNEIIKNQEKRITKLKIQKALSIGGGLLGAVTGFLIGFLIISH